MVIFRTSIRLFFYAFHDFLAVGEQVIGTLVYVVQCPHSPHGTPVSFRQDIIRISSMNIRVLLV